MFGLNEITWKAFITSISSGLLAWYLVLLAYAWIKSKNNPIVLYEDSRCNNGRGEEINPVVVSSKSFPSQLLSVVSENSIPLEVSVYEEVYPEDGYHINYFLDEKSGELVHMLPKIQYQQ